SITAFHVVVLEALEAATRGPWFTQWTVPSVSVPPVRVGQVGRLDPDVPAVATFSMLPLSSRIRAARGYGWLACHAGVEAGNPLVMFMFITQLAPAVVQVPTN